MDELLPSIIHRSSLAWDLHNLQVLNSNMFLAVDSNIPPFSSPLDHSHPSSGYLEDALLEFSDTSKRPRLMLYSNTLPNDSTHLIKNDLNLNSTWDVFENVSCMSPIEHISTSSGSRICEEDSVSSCEALESSSSYKNPINIISHKEPDLPSLGSGGEKGNKRVKTRVVYPFEVVKPGGIEGDLTLNDINQKILMPPARPVKHPVGKFACRRWICLDGPGLSGKAVVALTRVHTQGRRGTITIIRTKG